MPLVVQRVTAASGGTEPVRCLAGSAYSITPAATRALSTAPRDVAPLQTVKGGNPQVVLAAPDALPDVLSDAQ